MSAEKDHLFQEYYGEKIALYGLGTETQKALLSFEDHFEITGLLDSFQESGELYGKEILSLSHVIDEGVKLIIVIARPGSCKAIAKKISDICREHEIALMDIRGKNLLERKRVTYDFAGVKGGTKEELYRKIARAEVVSFDLFDTLIMREVLSSADIIELADAAWRERGVIIAGFAAKRLEAEKRLSQDDAPTLEVLYRNVLQSAGESISSAAEFAETEWQIDCKTIIRRQEMCEIFEECIRQKKDVYIVTDTYYRKEQIEEILRRCRLTGYKGLLVSCEYHTGKNQKLFCRLKEAEGEKNYLHIGDDLLADIEAPSREGMDTYRIYSGEELLDMVGNMGFEPYINGLAERIKAGIFAARLFNSPFQFELPEQKIALSDAYDIGYLICAPMITDFVFWFQERVKNYGIPNIWFCARDGYLLQKLYCILDANVETVYFQTSRLAAVRAGMTDESDIAYVDSMKFSGTLEENLKTRFGIEDTEPETEGPAGLWKYKKYILEKAAQERKKYNTYISRLNIKAGDIAFFDFVAKGTTQLYVQRLVEHHLKGLYFLQLEPDFMNDKGLDIEPFYGTDETEVSSIYDNYYILETILTAPHPGVCGFDDNGMPTFTEETRTEKDIRCFTQAQEGIMDYFRRYLELLPEGMRKQSKELDEVILGLIHNLEIKDDDFLSLVVEDPFFNRMTGIKELI